MEFKNGNSVRKLPLSLIENICNYNLKKKKKLEPPHYGRNGLTNEI